jgi:ABC-type branched-subunit amino acid transport system ATPase component
MVYVEVIGPNGSEKTALVNCAMVLNLGEKLAEGSPEEVMTKQRVKEAYVGSEGGRC